MAISLPNKNIYTGLRLLCCMIASVMITGCHTPLTPAQVAEQKNYCQQQHVYAEGFSINFTGFTKEELQQGIQISVLDSAGHESSSRDTLLITALPDKTFSGIFDFRQSLDLRSTLVCDIAGKKFNLSHFILAPNVVTTGTGAESLQGCTMDSLQVNNQPVDYTRDFAISKNSGH